jgi:DNA-binding NarL/FixJ family response regulator
VKPRATTIVLAEAFPVVRAGLRCLLERERGFRVVGEASDGLEVGAAVERLRPDVCVLDSAMPGLYGPEATRQVRLRSPRTAVVVLSRLAHEGYAADAFRSGALGYVVEAAEAPELARAIRAAVRGERYLSAPLSAARVELWLRRLRAAPPDPYQALTDRERQVLQLIAEGGSSATIARRLTISPRTAEAHRANMMRKLRLRNTAGLIRFALERGILPLAAGIPMPVRGKILPSLS